MSKRLRPALPQIRFRIGVSGHRAAPKLPTEIRPAVEATVVQILAAVNDAVKARHDEFVSRWSFRGDAGSTHSAHERSFAQCVVVSSLAEGADRLVARAGLGAGLELEAVIPFARGEYSNDFATEESKAEFQHLLTSASSVFELDASPSSRPRAYEAAGLMVLENIDVLIAIWDGEEAQGVGGTEHIVRRAIAGAIPVVWIDPSRPGDLHISEAKACHLVQAGDRVDMKSCFISADADAVRRCVDALLRPPPSDPNSLAGTKSHLDLYLAERTRRWNLCLAHPILLMLFGAQRVRLNDIWLTSRLADCRKQWHEHYFRHAPRDSNLSRAIETSLLPGFTVADHLAVYYSLLYRGAYITSFVLAATASICVLADVIFGLGLLSLVELGAVFSLLAIWRLGSRGQWHRRWLEYRRLAEALRHFRVSTLVGSSGLVSRPGHDLDMHDPDWVNWYAWSVRRLLPLPNRAADSEYLVTVRDTIQAAEIEEQKTYHTINAQRMHRLDEGIERVGKWLFGLAMLASFTSLAEWATWKWFNLEVFHGLGQAAFFFAGALPAIAAALSAINVQGEFRTSAEQSKRTYDQLAAIGESLWTEPLSLRQLTQRTEQIASVVVSDLRDWHTIFRTRRLNRPG